MRLKEFRRKLEATLEKDLAHVAACEAELDLARVKLSIAHATANATRGLLEQLAVPSARGRKAAP